MITLIAGTFAYFSPKGVAINPLKMGMSPNRGNNVLDPGVEDSSTKKIQELNVTTGNGGLEIHQEVDELIQEKSKLEDQIKDEQVVLDNTKKQIVDLKAHLDGKNDQDLLKLKYLTKAMEDQQRLLVVHGEQLLTLNDQIKKNRQLQSQQRDMVNLNTQSSLDALEQRNDDLLKRNQDVIANDRQKAQDQQWINQQRQADQMQRIRDLQNR